MDDQELRTRFQRQDDILVKIYHSTEQARKYVFWRLIATIILLGLPLIGTLIALPALLNALGPALDSIKNSGL